jgi:hypothetical protein
MYNSENNHLFTTDQESYLRYQYTYYFNMSTTFNMSDNKSIISLSAISQLRNNANFAAWKQAVEDQLLLAVCIGIIDGSDMEPFRSPAAMAARLARAGSAPPTAEERIPDMDLTVEQLEEWRKWQKRDSPYKHEAKY